MEGAGCEPAGAGLGAGLVVSPPMVANSPAPMEARPKMAAAKRYRIRVERGSGGLVGVSDLLWIVVDTAVPFVG